MTAGDLFDPQMRLAMAMKMAIAERRGPVSEGTGVTITEARRQYAEDRAWWNADAPRLAWVIDDQLPGPMARCRCDAITRPPAALYQRSSISTAAAMWSMIWTPMTRSPG